MKGVIDTVNCCGGLGPVEWTTVGIGLIRHPICLWFTTCTWLEVWRDWVCSVLSALFCVLNSIYAHMWLVYFVTFVVLILRDYLLSPVQYCIYYLFSYLLSTFVFCIVMIVIVVIFSCHLLKLNITNIIANT